MIHTDKKIKEISATLAHDVSTPLLITEISAQNLKQHLPILLEVYQEALKRGDGVQKIPVRARQRLDEAVDTIEENACKIRTMINTFLAQLTHQPQYVVTEKETQPISEAIPPDPHPPQQKDKIIHVLLADDEPINQQVVGDMLEILGCQVDIADNGQAAITQWQNKSYDLILMDCGMPQLDGYQATQAIRREESNTNKIPIIALTANFAEDEERDRCLQAGMDDLMTKPLTLDQLRVTLEKFVTLP